MAQCPYCGESAGWLHKFHKPCKQQFDKAWYEIADVVYAECKREADLEPSKAMVARLVELGRLNADSRVKAIVSGWTRAVDESLEDSLFTDEEDRSLRRVVQAFGITVEQYGLYGADRRIAKTGLMRTVLDGDIPQACKEPYEGPFLLKNSEHMVWTEPNTDYYQDRTRTHFEGSSVGATVRVGKGVYLRSSSYKSVPVRRDLTSKVDTGLLGVGTENLYFGGRTKGLRIPYKKVVAFIPYSDALGVLQQAKSARRQLFLVEDGLFVYNLVINLARR